MNVFIIIFIIIISFVLFTSSIIIVAKIFGTGLFYGLKLNCVVILDNNDNVFDTLSEIYENIGVECLSSDTKIIIVDGGMNRGQTEICQNFCDKYEIFTLTTPDMLSDTVFTLNKQLVNKG